MRMTQETINHIRAVLEYYAETSSGKETDNAKANNQALQQLAQLEALPDYSETEKCERCGERILIGAICTHCGY